MSLIPEAALREAMLHCEAAYPLEGCGMFLRHPSGRITARPMANVARDPGVAFCFDPDEQLQVLESGAELVGVFHSHPDGSAYLSPEDRAQALAGGQPLWPGACHLVFSVRGFAREVRAFVWQNGDFAEELLFLPARAAR